MVRRGSCNRDIKAGLRANAARGTEDPRHNSLRLPLAVGATFLNDCSTRTQHCPLEANISRGLAFWGVCARGKALRHSIMGFDAYQAAATSLAARFNHISVCLNNYMVQSLPFEL
jgi:hypothetical protein